MDCALCKKWFEESLLPVKSDERIYWVCRKCESVWKESLK